MARDPERWKVHDLTVWAALIVLLALGWGVQAAAERPQTTYADPQGTLRIQYPSGWLPTAMGGSLLVVEDPLSGGLVPARLIVSREPRPTQRTIDQVAEGDILVRAGQLDLYRALSSEPRTVGGRQAVAIEYAYVVDPYEAALGAERIPVVVRGVEVLAPSDRFLYRIDFRAAESVFNVDRAVFERILRRVVF